MNLHRIDGIRAEHIGLQEGFEYSFDEKTRSSIAEVKGWIVVLVAIIYYGLIVVYSIVDLLKHGYSDEWLAFPVGMSLLPLTLLLLGNRQALNWIRESKCKICTDGIYRMMPKEKMEFVPWSDIAFVGRQRMTLARATYVPVICCYRSLTAKTLLEHAPRQVTNDLMYDEFYNRRDEIITLSYDKNRMSKIRALRGAGISQSKRLQELRDHDWDVFEKDRHI